MEFPNLQCTVHNGLANIHNAFPTIQWVLNIYSTTMLQPLGKYIYVYKGIMRVNGWLVVECCWGFPR